MSAIVMLESLSWRPMDLLHEKIQFYFYHYRVGVWVDVNVCLQRAATMINDKTANMVTANNKTAEGLSRFYSHCNKRNDTLYGNLQTYLQLFPYFSRLTRNSYFKSLKLTIRSNLKLTRSNFHFHYSFIVVATAQIHPKTLDHINLITHHRI